MPKFLLQTLALALALLASFSCRLPRQKAGLSSSKFEVHPDGKTDPAYGFLTYDLATPAETPGVNAQLLDTLVTDRGLTFGIPKNQAMRIKAGVPLVAEPGSDGSSLQTAVQQYFVKFPLVKDLLFHVGVHGARSTPYELMCDRSKFLFRDFLATMRAAVPAGTTLSLLLTSCFAKRGADEAADPEGEKPDRLEIISFSSRDLARMAVPGTDYDIAALASARSAWIELQSLVARELEQPLADCTACRQLTFLRFLAMFGSSLAEVSPS